MSVAPGRREAPYIVLLAGLVAAPIVLPETSRAATRLVPSAPSPVDVAAAVPGDSLIRSTQSAEERRVGDLRPVNATTKGSALMTHAAPGPDGPFELSSASVELLLDAFGAFGSASSGGSADFTAGSRTASTVFEWMAHVSGAGFLDGGSLLLPQSAAGARRDGSAVVASYEVDEWGIDVRSELLDCDEPDCAALRQEWTVVNRSSAERELVLTFYLDGDLFFEGAWANDHGAIATDLYQFDDGSDPAEPSTFLGLDAESADSLSRSREVAEFPEQRRRIGSGGSLVDGVLRRTSGVSSDLDGDGVTDSGYDVSIAEQHRFGRLATGESITIVSHVRWGLGSLDELAPLAADAGGDRTIECEGVEGTVVGLDGGASSPVDDIAEWLWSIDGELVAEGASADVVLSVGDHLVSLEVRDAAGRSDIDEALIRIVDTTAPVLTPGEEIVLWPPDHRLVRVELPVDAFDACSDEVVLDVLAVDVDEPVDVRRGGDGHHAADVVIDEDGALWLRRERQGVRDGRTYLVEVGGLDAAGNLSTVTVVARVPGDMRERAGR